MKWLTRAALGLGFFLGLGVQQAIAGGAIGVTSPGVSNPLQVQVVQTNLLDAGVVNVSAAGAECAIGVTSTNSSTFRAICLDRVGGGNATNFYISSAGGNGTITGGANIDVTTGSGNTLHLNTGAAGAVRMTGSQSIGTCTLNGGSPSTCTATVRASSVCACSIVGTTAAIAAKGCAVSLSSTTLTVTSANGATEVVNYHCF